MVDGKLEEAGQEEQEEKAVMVVGRAAVVRACEVNRKWIRFMYQ